MTDIVQRLALDFRCNQVHFEPLYPIGRGLNVCGDVPSPETFAAGFVTASVEGEKKGVNVHFSGGSLRMRKINCGGCGENMVVLPTGQVTTCVEVSRPSDPYFKMFHVGICEPDKVVIDGETLQTLRERRVSKMESCASCFARNYCAGGCPIKAVKASGSLYDHGNNLQCQITRLVIEGALKHHINVHFSTTDERSAVL